MHSCLMQERLACPLGAAHGDSVAVAADLLQFKGVVAAHRPALAGAIDHLPAVGGGRPHRREREGGLLGVGEGHREAVLGGGLGSAGGRDAVDRALQRPLGLVLNRWSTSEIVGLAGLPLAWGDGGGACRGLA